VRLSQWSTGLWGSSPGSSRRQACPAPVRHNCLAHVPSPLRPPLSSVSFVMPYPFR
jgi:hypothetical protein